MIKKGVLVGIVVVCGSLQARTLVQFAAPSSPEVASNGSLLLSPAGSGSAGSPVPVAAAVVESMDEPASFFASFRPAPAFATLAMVTDLKKAVTKMQDAVDAKYKEVLKAQGGKSAVDDFLKAVEKNQSAAADGDAAHEKYQKKRDEYLQKHPDKNSQFRQLEAAVASDSSKEAAFKTLLNAADLLGAWKNDQEAQATARSMAALERKRWVELDKNMQAFVIAYRRKKAEIDQAGSARRAALAAGARGASA